jgi:cytochrome oxidase Cu insertion factor (SCO1/SenC/PrrC family)
MQARKTLPVVMACAFVLAACATSKSMPETTMPVATEAMMEQPTQTMMVKSEEMMASVTPEPMMETPAEAMPGAGEMMATPTPEGMMSVPSEMMATVTPEGMMGGKVQMMAPSEWYSATLENVSDGKAFTINDLKGKVVLVEMMAQWCPTCLSQEKQVKDLHTQLGMRDDLIIVGLDIDPHEDGVTLKSYQAKYGFNWTFAVAPAEVAREISNLYGAQFLNPPSTPMLIIDRNGEVHPLPFGVKTSEELMKALEPYLAQGM